MTPKEIHDFYDKFVESISLENEWDYKLPNTKETVLGGNILFDEAEILYNFIKQNKSKIGLQIGTFIGYSGAFIAQALKENNGTFTTIDPNHPHRCVREPVVHAKEAFRQLGLGEMSTFIEGYSYSQNSIYDVRQIFLNPKQSKENVIDEFIRDGKKFDFIFIDGNHAYEQVKKDFEGSVKLLTDKGVIVFHDVNGTDRVADFFNSIQGFNKLKTKTQAGLGFITRGEIVYE